MKLILQRWGIIGYIIILSCDSRGENGGDINTIWVNDLGAGFFKM